ncbi:helix-turn-helix domain-containing protein [Streptomyces sp. NA04227]|uniref:helix-turn-helix domain-containing protein n=1 Tax=Streptomyces sp. NA04227 TaxID=2742136 RepID=UPI00159003FB|nr:helix-turn-helix domain-containing protein [Streptomyces sp. NA04227]QKW08437.1 helix-turn-helix domain-containing protein [Streptomyces sp. NA04227]
MSEVPPSSAHIPGLVRRWRARRNVEDIPEARALAPQRGRASRTLTQARMAALLDVSERHYQRLESGTRPLTAELAERMAYLLDLNADERTVLHEWAGLPVPLRRTPGTSVPEDLLDYMDRLPFLAYFEDPEYNAVAYNAHAAHNLPWMVGDSAEQPGPANIMTALLLEGPGRAQCVQWETHWAPMLLAGLRYQFMTYPSHALRALVEKVCEDPQVRAMWDEDSTLSYHAYGMLRPLLLPPDAKEPLWVTVMAWSPVNRPDLRMISAVPAKGTAQPALPPGVTGGGVARRSS